MDRVLQEIKSVQGVSGVLVLDKKGSIVYQLTPASFPEEGLKEIGLRLSRLVKVVSAELRLEIKFENGIAYLYNLEKELIFIFGRLGINKSILELVLKSAILTIERKLLREEGSASSHEERKSSFILDRIYIEHLVQVLNQIAEIFKQKLGVYLVTQNLRKSKEEFLPKFDLLQNFFVENSGEISYIKGKENDIPTDSLKVFALWISLFIHLCYRYEPGLSTDIRELSRGFEDKLEQMGFYEVYERVKKDIS